MTIKEAIAKVVERGNLTETEMIAVMSQVMSGDATPVQIGAFLTALRMKGETVEEITGAARVMRERATQIHVRNTEQADLPSCRSAVLDVVGTGGDGTNTFNISTTVSLVVSACGVKVAKHGNRSVSSMCGSADVLEALGVNLNVSAEVVEQCIAKIGIGFLYAPALHGAMRHAIGPRREIGIRTLFNILGPLTNPARADCQVMGVYREDLVERLAWVLYNLGSRSSFVVHGLDGMDEITLTAPTRIARVNSDRVTLFTLQPDSLGFSLCPMEALRGGDARQNAALVRGILEGQPGPRRDIVLLNAAYSLIAVGLVSEPFEGIGRAAEAIDSGRAAQQLSRLIEWTNA
jgi:anthranilate phosphoribosyltransferase